QTGQNNCREPARLIVVRYFVVFLYISRIAKNKRAGNLAVFCSSKNNNQWHAGQVDYAGR
ncbi:hypothetical protein, partial [Serratia sp. (in: enterobacteria)]|uniref:hypothetical protein n=1 Tax=Serratia sp. (in: enterobacteria) TaxID=616 RepID=UPI00289F51C9